MSEIETMLTAAIEAAGAISEIYARGTVARQKADGSPVTEADACAEEIILRHLAPLGLPIVAEESVAAGRIPALGERFFCVDPLDGTKEFLKRNGEFTVNIALVAHGRPRLGVILAPVTGATYWGTPEGAHVGDVSVGAGWVPASLKGWAGTWRALQPARAMPFGCTHSQHMAMRDRPTPMTMPVAITLAMAWPRSDRRSVSIATAKSSLSRVMAEAPMKVSQTTE